MVWVRIDDGFAEHPKLARVGPLGMAMQVAALCYCNRKLTDGFVPRSVARTLLDFEVDGGGLRWTLARTSGHAGDDIDAEWVIGLLVEAGIWEEVQGGYVVHDFGDYQPLKDDVVDLSAKRSAAGRAGAAARWHADSNANGKSHSKPVAKECPEPEPVPQEPTPPVEPPRRKRRATRMPEGWEPTEAHRRVAAEERVDVDREAQRFRDWAEAGGHSKVDWDAAFRNWLRNDTYRRRDGPPGPADARLVPEGF